MVDGARNRREGDGAQGDESGVGREARVRCATREGGANEMFCMPVMYCEPKGARHDRVGPLAMQNDPNHSPHKLFASYSSIFL